MNAKLKKTLALVLGLALVFSMFVACAEPAAPAETTDAAAAEAEAMPEPAEASSEPAEEPEATAEPAVDAAAVTETAYPEATELAAYLKLLVGADYSAALTAAQADEIAAALGLAETGLDADATSVTGAEFLNVIVQALGYPPAGDAEQLNKTAHALHLMMGIDSFDAAAALSCQQAAQIMRNALLCYTVDASSVSTGVKLASTVGLEHVVILDYEELFNRPGSKWIKADTQEDVTAAYAATPVYVSYGARSWCDILEGVCHFKDGTPNNDMVTFQNTVNGGEYSVRFEKCHWGDDGHSGCANDFTGDTGMSVEMYQVSDTEYRNVLCSQFMAKVDTEGIRLYGYNYEVWGPWLDENLPADGYYIVRYAWNAYGLGEGYEIIAPATVVEGLLDSADGATVTIDGVTYTSAAVFNLGAGLVNSPLYHGASKPFTFYFDQYGLLIGAIEKGN